MPKKKRWVNEGEPGRTRKNWPGVLFLELQNNRITDITPLLALPALKYLDLSHNPVTDSSAIEELKKKLGENFLI